MPSGLRYLMNTQHQYVLYYLGPQGFYSNCRENWITEKKNNRFLSQSTTEAEQIQFNDLLTKTGSTQAYGMMKQARVKNRKVVQTNKTNKEQEVS